MKNRRKTLHRGEILQDAVNDSGYSITKVTKLAGFSRASYYNHILDPELPLDILEKYGRAIKHDFSEDIPNIGSSLIQEDEKPKQPSTLAEALRELNAWKEKYYQLLEKYRQMLEEKVKR